MFFGRGEVRGTKEQGAVCYSESVSSEHDRSQAGFSTITEELQTLWVWKICSGLQHKEYLPPPYSELQQEVHQRCLKFLLSAAALLFLIALPKHLSSHYATFILTLL